MDYYTVNISATDQVLRALALQAAVAHGDEDPLPAANRYYEWLRGGR